MSYVVVVLGTRDTVKSEIDYVCRFHVCKGAFWSNRRHRKWPRGSGVVAKIAGVGVVALTGILDCDAPEPDELRDDDAGRRWLYRYNVKWEEPPREPVPVAELGPPFDGAIRGPRTITREDFERARRALDSNI